MTSKMLAVWVENKYHQKIHNSTSCVLSERVFSTAGHIASRAHGCLLPQNVSKLLFLAKNMQ